MAGNPLLKNMGGMNMQQVMVQNLINNNPQLRNAYALMQRGGNPQQILQNMMAQNPQARNVIQQMQNSGMSAEQYVRNLAKQYNVNIDQFLSSFRRR